MLSVKGNGHRLILGLILSSICFHRAQAQNSNLVIVPPRIPEFVSVPLDSARLAPSIVDVVAEKSDLISSLEPYILVFWNQSSQRIKGLTISWSKKDSVSDRPTTEYVSNVSYTSQNVAVLGAGSQLLLMPTGFVDSSLLGRGAALPQIPTPRSLQELKRAKEVTVEIDAMIFEDGQVWGPDRSRTIENLIMRRTAMDALVERTRVASSRGSQVGTVLNSFASKATWEPTGAAWQLQLKASSDGGSDLFGFWMAENARVILSSNSSARSLESFSRLPDLPAFYRLPK